MMIMTFMCYYDTGYLGKEWKLLDIVECDSAWNTGDL